MIQIELRLESDIMDEFIPLMREDHAMFAKDTFSSLLNSGDYADVTLVDQDNIRSNAHKLILGAASKFFRDIFASTPHPHPVIYLRIPNRDMVALLSFMYEGKCAVAEAGINDFMLIASDLGIMPDENGEEGEVIVLKKTNENVSETPAIETTQQNPTDDNDEGQGKPLSKANLDRDEAIKEEADSKDFKDANTTALSNNDDIIKIEKKEIVSGRMTLCTFCGRKFSRSRALKSHIEFKHSDGKLDACTHCGKILSDKCEMNRHIATMHSDRKKEVCKVCEKTFTKRKYLMEHMKFKHSGEQNDRCDKCDKIFSDPWSMKTHKQFVHEDKSLSCDLCPFKTRRKPSMTEHMKTMHEGFRYKCQFGCTDFAATNKTKYMRHIFAEHNTE